VKNAQFVAGVANNERGFFLECHHGSSFVGRSEQRFPKPQADSKKNDSLMIPSKNRTVTCCRVAC